MNAEYLTCADTAKMLVRPALKAAFPGVKFSVRSETYSGGASISISWTDGPTEQAVQDITDQFRSVDFDGMTDSATYRAPLLIAFKGEELPRQVRSGAHYINGSRDLSAEYKAALRAEAEKIVGEPLNDHADYDGLVTPYGITYCYGADSLIRWMSQHVPAGAV